MNAPACPRCADHRSVAFHVAEMDCAHEVAILEKRLTPVDGVVALQADVLTRQLRVHFDGARLTTAQIAEAVAQTGMRAWPVTAAVPVTPRPIQRAWPLVAASAASVVAAGVWLLEGPHLLLRALLLAAIVVVAPATLRRAWMAVRGRRLDMHVLMTVAVIGALVIDEWFEAATVLVLFGVAQALEARSLERARRAIAEVMDVTPPTADVRRDALVTTVPVADVRVGETVSVRPGARIPLDGVVTEGESTVDQAPVTGESDPVLKVTGDTVYAGSVNGDGTLHLEVSRLSDDSTVARIVHLVERAHAARAAVQSTVDRFAVVYTPIVLGLAVLLATVPPLLGGGAWLTWIHRALVLLVVACPCALVIATPVAMVSALSAAARRGLLLKGGAVLERLAAIRVVALDKTGTLSEGRLRIVSVTAIGHLPLERALQLAAALEAGLHHPLAEAIVAHADQLPVPRLTASGVQHVPGRGATAIVDGHRVRIGRPSWLREVEAQANVPDDATTVLTVDGVPSLAVVARDQPRASAPAAVARLRRLVDEVAVLSGDQHQAVQHLASAIGVTGWHARLFPDEKARVVAELAARGPVLMVGDGINDGPALAAASVGLAIADSGNAVAMEAADGALMHRDLALVPYAIALGRAAVRTVRVNVALALALKVAVIVAAAAGAASLWLAVLADVGASLLVVGLSLRLLSFEPVTERRA